MTPLEQISREMREQDNRSTQYPLFVVQSLKRVEGENHSERLEDHENDMCEVCTKNAELGEEVADYCEDCGSECFRSYDLEYQNDDQAGVFFTEQACHEHIRLNDYHYTKPRSYVISAWRNPEMVAVMQSILKLTGEEIPNHYK